MNKCTITGKLMCYPQFSSNENLYYILIEDNSKVPDVLLRERMVPHYKEQQNGYKPRNAESSKHREKPCGQLCLFLEDQEQIADCHLGEAVTADFEIKCVCAPYWNDREQVVDYQKVPRSFAMMVGNLQKAQPKAAK